MVYLTHYTEYPIYEPAEGGYYYAGNEANEYYRLNSVKQAKRKLPKCEKNLKLKDLKFMKMKPICTANI